MTEPVADPAPVVPVAPATPQAPYAPPSQPVAPRRALGTTGFVLSLLAFLGDFVVGIVLIGTFISAIGSFAGFIEGKDDGGFGTAAAVFIAAIVVGLAGTLLALAGVILGSIAAARNRGRVLGVFAIVLGALVLVTRILLIIASATSGSGNS
jgi:hypothetical protein